ncbi:MAG: LacI family DNA-binding transcriptional regulator [Propionicimonas sp.]|uniref:LacI family DNA-binding transcriptional regulator n=1 Tax=Propionicimonas sp. TaxID=1955623 RepID=UPI002B20B656|nr:LacI family DNA-binding transcriptional regulator [Propionicimonas sp.]MEA4945521.1 LacI family DNA-binding transcriptional regulator [Propionicimonas sp.]MEA5055067.1 LacI family DNA-binding transcriptional regulator [Propionicimonas sp.]
MAINAQHSVTIEDVARTAGVSRAAVSKVIRDAYGVSPEMRAKVQAAIDELGYRPRVAARAMRGATYTFGVEIPSILNQFFPKIINGASQTLADSRYQLIIAPAVPEDAGFKAIEALADRQVDGIVVITRVPYEWLENLGRKLPLVAIGSHYASKNYDTLVGDDLLGAALAVRHLYDLGHRRIVHLTLNESRDPSNVGAPHSVRQIGYERAVEELGLSPEIVWVEPDVAAAEASARALLRSADGPVGLFVSHDELALGVLTAVADLGLTPAQASVVGYDDIDIAAHPRMSLTSINQSGTRMGEIAVRLLLERIAGRVEPVHEVVTPKVMVRGSTAAPDPHTPQSTGTVARATQESR